MKLLPRRTGLPTAIWITQNDGYGHDLVVANVPEHDRFQVVTRHEPDEIIYPEQGYRGIDYTPDLIIIQVIWVGGRSTEVKKNILPKLS